MTEVQLRDEWLCGGRRRDSTKIRVGGSVEDWASIAMALRDWYGRRQIYYYEIITLEFGDWPKRDR
jgi:hypothetical protein